MGGANRNCHLVADIGGTNARFAILRGDPKSGFEAVHTQRLRAEDFEALRDAALAFLQTYDGEQPSRACFAVAGPVGEGEVRLTNSPWRFNPPELAKTLGVERLIAVNDWEALGRGAPLTPESELVTVREGKGRKGAPIAVLGPGTGLGMSYLHEADGPRPRVISTEAGHAAFAPCGEDEIDVLLFVAREFGYVSWERLLSGRGLVTLHRAICRRDGVAWPNLRPDQVTRAAMDGSDPRAVRALDMFCAALGTFAGDAVLMGGARGGVYLGGGILPRIKDFFLKSRFNACFNGRDLMEGYFDDLPVRLIMTDMAALYGAAAFAGDAS
jgi:glucokinase